MMNDKVDSLDIEVKADGVKLSTSGGSASGVIQAIGDLLSPFTNAFGMVGDQLKIARHVATLRAAQKAREMLAKDGIHSGDVPPKILLPWLEGASLELDEDEALQAAWGGLLARAVKSPDAATVSYMDVLRKMGTKEAELLSFYSGDTAPFFSSKFYGLNGIEPFSTENPLFENATNRLDKLDTLDEQRKYFDGLGLQMMRQVIFFSVDGGRYNTTPYFDENEVAVSNLEHLGLVKIVKRSFDSRKHQVSVVWFELTKFGFDMMWACNGQKTGGEHQFFNEK